MARPRAAESPLLNASMNHLFCVVLDLAFDAPEAAADRHNLLWRTLAASHALLATEGEPMWTRLVVLLVGTGVTAACGQAAASELPTPPEVPATSQREEETPAKDRFYLPSYSAGAAALVADGDRDRRAEESYRLWQETEQFDQPESVGQRDSAARWQSLQDSLDVSSDELDELRLDSEQTMSDSGIAVAPTDRIAPLYLPIFAELANVCEQPSAVALFAAEADGEPSALNQYGSVRPLSEKEYPPGISRAWQVDDQPKAVTYAFQTVAVPEVLLGPWV